MDQPDQRELKSPQDNIAQEAAKAAERLRGALLQLVPNEKPAADHSSKNNDAQQGSSTASNAKPIDDAKIFKPVSAEDRLQIVSKAACEALQRFEQLDTSDNKYLGKHELANAAKSGASTELLLKYYDNITPLYYDYVPTGRRRIGQDYLGVSKNDLEVFKSLTSKNPEDIDAMAKRLAIRTGPGELGVLLGGVGASSAAIMSWAGIVSRRQGLIGAGIGLGLAGAGLLVGYRQEKEHLQNLRHQISHDTSLDLNVFKARGPELNR